jgi:glycosyltransferase involved in cell wall biosynthesis
MALNWTLSQTDALREATTEVVPDRCTQRLPIKVALLTNCIPPYWTTTFSNLAARFEGFRAFLSTPMEADRDWEPEWGDVPVTVQRCITYAAHRKHELGFSERVWRHIPYDTLPALVRERPDVVISAQLGFRTLQAAIYRKLFPRTRLVLWTPLSEHSERGISLARTLQRKALLGAADAILVNGPSGMAYLRKLGVRRQKIFFLPYCADVQRLLSLPLSRPESASHRLLYVGQLVERKGLQPFLEALSQWVDTHPKTDLELWIAGEGPLRPVLEQLASRRQLQVRFLGSVAYEKLPEMYALGGILVFPTLADEWGVVVNEALAAGLPVLGSQYSQAVTELVRHGVNGWVFRPDHPDQIQGALERALSASGEQISAMRDECRGRVQVLTPEFGADCFARAVRFAWCSGSRRS